MKGISSYKIRYYLVLVLIPIMVIVCWKLTLSHTYKYYSQISELKKNAAKYQNANVILTNLEAKLDKLSSSEPIDSEQIDEFLMEVISNNISNYKITLESIPEREINTMSSYTIHTYNLRFSGRYVSLLKFIDFLESELVYGSIISIGFQRTELRKTGEILYADIYYQLIFNNASQ